MAKRRSATSRSSETQKAAGIGTRPGFRLSREWVSDNLWTLRHHCAGVFHDLFAVKLATEETTPSFMIPHLGEVVAEEEYRLISEVFARDATAQEVYADWLEEQGMVFAAQAHRFALLGYSWKNIEGSFLSFMAPVPHPTLVTQTLGMCLSVADPAAASVMLWSLAPSSVNPEEQWALSPEDFAELRRQLEAKKPIHAEFRGTLPFQEAVLNILGIAQFWETEIRSNAPDPRKSDKDDDHD